MIEFAAGIGLLAAAAFCALWLRIRRRWRAATAAAGCRRRRRRRARRRCSPRCRSPRFCGGAVARTAASGPLHEAAPPISPTPGFSLASRMTDAARVGAAIAALREAGTPFDLTALSAADGAAFEIAGVALEAATASSGSPTSPRCGAPRRRTATPRAAAAALRETVDALPLPVWRRGPRAGAQSTATAPMPRRSTCRARRRWPRARELAPRQWAGRDADAGARGRRQRHGAQRAASMSSSPARAA